MKTALTIAALMASMTAAHAKGTKFICKETRTYGPKKSMILTQVSEREIREGVSERFVLEVYEGSEKNPTLKTEGRVSTEDVMFQFKSYDGKVSAMLYLDELDQSNLTYKGQTTNFDCQ